MSTPAMHLEQPQPVKCRRDGCEVLFAPKTRWQAFCSVKCRNDHHGSRDPQKVWREIEKLQQQVKDLKAATEGLKASIEAREPISTG